MPVETKKDAPLRWRLPVNIGVDLLKESAAGKRLKEWKKIGYDWPNKIMRGHIYLSPDGGSILVVNDFVEMIVLGNRNLGTAKELVARCGSPKARRGVHQGEVWSYGQKWSVLVKDGKIREVWISG